MGGSLAALTPAQRAALGRVAALVGPGYYLVGGVAVALRFHHRASHALDVFTLDADPDALIDAVDASRGIRLISRSKTTLHLDVDGTPTSLIRYAYPLLAPTETVDELPLAVASVDDLISIKLSAIVNSGAARDFWDLHTMLTGQGRSLHSALMLFERKFAAHDIGHVVRALCYFDDADSAPMPRGLDSPSWDRICADFRTWVTDVSSAR